MSHDAIWKKITDDRKRAAWLARVENVVGALPDYPWEQSYEQGMGANEAAAEYLENYYGGYQQKTVAQIEAETEVLRQQLEDIRSRRVMS